jgi:hypothetical protein
MSGNATYQALGNQLGFNGVYGLMADVNPRQFSVTIALSLVLGIAAQQASATSIPETERWDNSRMPLKISSVPQLKPESTFTLPNVQPDGSEQIENIVMINDVFIVLTRNPQANGQHLLFGLRALDLRTGRLSSSLDVSFPRTQFAAVPNIYASSPESVALEFEGSLVEYDKRLKARGRMNLPKGRGLRQAPAYGYGDWAAVTATECHTPITAFFLNLEEELITGCEHEMGVLDQNGKLIFAERYKRDRIDEPQIAADGKRFLFELLDPDKSGDPPPPPWRNPPAYVLYDLHGDGPRRISFSTLPRKLGFEAATLSADGRTLALYSANRISLYRLPD